MRQGYYTDTKKISGSNVWQDLLNQFYSGGGHYWIPDPAYGSTIAQLQAIANKAQLFVDEFENYFTYIFKSEYTNPMHALQNLLKQKKYLYDLAIAEAQKVPLPPVTGDRGEEVKIPDDIDTEKNNTMLYLLAAAVGGVLLLRRSKKKRQRRYA